MALRMNALLLGSLLSRSASSFSTLKATTAVLGTFLDMDNLAAERGVVPKVGLEPTHP